MTNQPPTRFKLLLLIFIAVLAIGAVFISRGCIQADERRHVKASDVAAAVAPSLFGSGAPPLWLNRRGHIPSAARRR